jgi:hypothetical protein
MVQVVLGPRDIGGNLASALSSGYKSARESHEGEQRDARTEQRKIQYGRDEEARQESRLTKALQTAYDDPQFKEGDLETRQQILIKAITPINPEIAQKIAGADVDRYKAQNPTVKPTKPSADVVSPENQKWIDEYIETGYKNDTPSQVYSKALAGTNSKSIANNLRGAKQAEDKQKSENDKALNEDPYRKKSLEEAAKVASSQYEAILEKGERAKQGLISLEGAESVVKSTGFSLRDYLADKLKRPEFKDPKREEFKTYMKDRFRVAKEIAGGKVSNFEFQTIEDMLASNKKSVQANEAILRFFRMSDEIELARSKAAQQIAQENGGFPPLNFMKKIEEVSGPEQEAIVQNWREQSFPDKKTKSKAAVEPKNDAKQGMVKVRFGGKTGSMPKEKYESAIKAGEKYELIK